MNVFKKEVKYKGQKIILKCTKSEEQDRCFNCPIKYDISSFIDLILHVKESKSIKDTELERYVLIHVDTAKNVIDNHENNKNSLNIVPHELEALGFKIDNTKS